MKKILIIQTAFIGDTVLATSLVEKLKSYYPDAVVDFLLRKGNEGVLYGNPLVGKVWVWIKKQNKYKNLMALLKNIRRERYDLVINAQRYAATGLLTAFSGAKETRGFQSNPLSFLFSKRFHYSIDKDRVMHETNRLHVLIRDLTDELPAKPRIYPGKEDEAKAALYKTGPYVTLTPSSAWFTKQLPFQKWVAFMDAFDRRYRLILLGGKDNITEAEALCKASNNPNTLMLAGAMNFTESAALMRDAEMNYVHDSAPLHFCSAINAPVTAIFCSTVPEFGFTPLSDKSYIVQYEDALSCRPCGFHGRKSCPKNHFKCGFGIPTEKLLSTLH
jgi:heptosyltransferase-2